MSRTVMLTTTDNPYDPFTDYDNWLSYDTEKNHNCCGLLARVAFTSDSHTDDENVAIIEAAIDDIVRYDLTNQYKKVVVND